MFLTPFECQYSRARTTCQYRITRWSAQKAGRDVERERTLTAALELPAAEQIKRYASLPCSYFSSTI